jgi:elongation factor Ts
MAFGLIASFVHSNGLIGVLVEVHCENDVTPRTVQFKDLVKNLAMQIAAYPKCEYIRIEDIPDEVVAQKRALEIAKEDILQKPDAILEKIIQDRVRKSLEEMIVLEQSYIRDRSITVGDLLERSNISLRENIKIHRFVRFTLDSSLPPGEDPNTQLPLQPLPNDPKPLDAAAQPDDFI